MYLLVKAAGKYWRQDYTHADKRKTLALGTYPEVSLLKARQRREKARELLADGIDPSAAKQEEKATKRAASANTFEVVAREWLDKSKADRMAGGPWTACSASNRYAGRCSGTRWPVAAQNET